MCFSDLTIYVLVNLKSIITETEYMFCNNCSCINNLTLKFGRILFRFLHLS